MAKPFSPIRLENMRRARETGGTVTDVMREARLSRSAASRAVDDARTAARQELMRPERAAAGDQPLRAGHPISWGAISRELWSL